MEEKKEIENQELKNDEMKDSGELKNRKVGFFTFISIIIFPMIMVWLITKKRGYSTAATTFTIVWLVVYSTNYFINKYGDKSSEKIVVSQTAWDENEDFLKKIKSTMNAYPMKRILNQPNDVQDQFFMNYYASMDGVCANFPQEIRYENNLKRLMDAEVKFCNLIKRGAQARNSGAILDIVEAESDVVNKLLSIRDEIQEKISFASRQIASPKKVEVADKDSQVKSNQAPVWLETDTYLRNTLKDYLNGHGGAKFKGKESVIAMQKMFLHQATFCNNYPPKMEEVSETFINSIIVEQKEICAAAANGAKPSQSQDALLNSFNREVKSFGKIKVTLENAKMTVDKIIDESSAGN